MKIEKIRDYDGEIMGYKLGSFYLMKIYTWGNSYSWCINSDGRFYYYQCEQPEYGWYSSCKEGKAKLHELAGC